MKYRKEWGQNYKPNTKQWKVGDIVIHDADAKEPRMLMVVTGYKEDLCETMYLVSKHFDSNQRRYWKADIYDTMYLGARNTEIKDRRYLNDIRYLHDPRRFKISVGAKALLDLILSSRMGKK